ncbi:hypothetical protein A0H81_04496 [Grifola frondosa]|uniref:Uncharacterized protein n=1 Tax=Grifola frondosa TaxID=5627 RepID=A0A1C7MFM6_GRIFR|nr:hypothetical protein A0H81_04496 [Grifola frondosa]
MGGQNAASGPPRLQIDPGYGQNGVGRGRASNPPSGFSPSTDPFNPFALRSPDVNGRNVPRRNGGMPSATTPTSVPYGAQSPSLNQTANLIGMNQASYNGMAPQSVPPHVYQAYMYQMYQQQNPNMGAFHA